jgi:EAL domain-containing protein (putative c-di-GMP-specific phosphodiesterase class I)
LTTAGTSADWDDLLDGAVRGGLDVVFQPVVDLQSGLVAGYEALTRFNSVLDLTPDRWFAAARERGRVAELDAVVVQTVLAARQSMPEDCFLALNVELDSLGNPLLDEALYSVGPLDGIVVEITEHVSVEDYDALQIELSKVRHHGALIALDDAGADYAGLQQMLRFRPEIIKLDRALVEGIHLDPVKRALVEMIGLFASRIDAWLLAEGVECAEEAAALRALQVPFAQGFFFAPPMPPWQQPTIESERFYAAQSADRSAEPAVRDLLSRTPSLARSRIGEARAAFASTADDDWLVVVDEEQHPLGLMDRDAALVDLVHPALQVHLTTTVVEIAHRMLTRPSGECFRPVICHDDLGRYVGTITPERVFGALASLAATSALVINELRDY